MEETNRENTLLVKLFQDASDRFFNLFVLCRGEDKLPAWNSPLHEDATLKVTAERIRKMESDITSRSQSRSGLKGNENETERDDDDGLEFDGFDGKKVFDHEKLFDCAHDKHDLVVDQVGGHDLGVVGLCDFHSFSFGSSETWALTVVEITKMGEERDLIKGDLEESGGVMGSRL